MDNGICVGNVIAYLTLLELMQTKKTNKNKSYKKVLLRTGMISLSARLWYVCVCVCVYAL